MMNKRLKTLPLAVAAAALVTVTSVLAVANQAKPVPVASSATSSATSPAAEQAVSQLSAEQVQMQKAGVIAAAGRSAIQHIDAAQQLLAAGDADKASEYLHTSQKILGQIEAVLTKEGAAPGADSVIPIYARLGIVEGTELSPEMKKGLDAVAPMVAAGQHQQVVERLKSFGIGMSYSHVELRLAAASEQVDLAVKALDAKDVDAASKALQAATETLVTETVTVGMKEAAVTKPAQAAAVAPASTVDNADG